MILFCILSDCIIISNILVWYIFFGFWICAPFQSLLAGLHVKLINPCLIIRYDAFHECRGVTYPCIHAIWANWAPPLERSKLATIGFSGSFFGTVFAMPIAGLIAEYWGWPFIFYIFGTAGLVWFICWWFIVKDRPEDDRFISKAELEYIKSSLDNDEKKKAIHGSERTGVFGHGTQWPETSGVAIAVRYVKSGDGGNT
ncbi:hypothetical protein P5V15_004386 [Pogonomyrmex californicus]